MGWIEWNDALSVGVEKIDKQHQTLIDILNLLYDKIQEGKDKFVIEIILSDLIDYTKYHFAAEEDYFEKLNYHDVEKHKKAHKGFVDKINKFYDDYKNNDAEISSKLLDFLKDWLINHIMVDDQSYGQYFISK